MKTSVETVQQLLAEQSSVIELLEAEIVFKTTTCNTAWVKCGPVDLQTDQQANCGPNLQTRSAVYLLVGPQVRIIYISLSSLLLTFVL